MKNFSFVVLGSIILVAAWGCSGSHVIGFSNDGGVDMPDTGMEGDADLGGSDASTEVIVTPQNQVLTVIDGQAIPTLQFNATVNGNPVAAQWQVDRGELGSIDANGLFTPKGLYGGKLNVMATYQTSTGSAPLTVAIQVVQNGANDPPRGVGGEGTGGPVDQNTVNVLNGSPAADNGLSWLYPYEGTMWPHGLLAPLLQWKPGAQTDYDALYVHAHESTFDYKGYFAIPANAPKPFAHHPIPQKAWEQMTYSNTSNEDLIVDLVLAHNGVAYGPITEKWKVAKGSLKGTLYYNSYGTKIANSGAATLAIKHGDTQPSLITGTNDCRACHVVSADGSTLITQVGNFGNDCATSSYDLKNNNKETALMPQDCRFSWGGLTPNGSLLLSHSSLANNYGGGMNWPGGLVGASTQPSSLYALSNGQSMGTGIPNGLKTATPAFSGDGKHTAFNVFSSDQRSLGIMDYNAGTKTFSNFLQLYTPPGQNISVWPTFLPSGTSVVFEQELTYNGRDFGGTRASQDGGNTGTRAELWWVDVATKKAMALDKLNGKGYLPQGPNGHTEDAVLNYEPTIAPVGSAGYAWVVFTSRRIYGNVANINAYWSDPRFHDLTTTPTTKKLWVAAIDLNAKPGTDPSHPAFYLPGQELLAGNARGYWVLDPCKTDGKSCETGDECCGGYCSQQNGQLVCSPNKPMCANEGDVCTIDADCCKGFSCIGGRCGYIDPP
jgi:hypothetical protein